MAERRDLPSFSISARLDEEYVKYLDYISKMDISHDAPHN